MRKSGIEGNKLRPEEGRDAKSSESFSREKKKI